jgi:hypothetical protein
MLGEGSANGELGFGSSNYQERPKAASTLCFGPVSPIDDATIP